MIWGQFQREKNWPKELKAEKVEKWYSSFRKRIVAFGLEDQAAQKNQWSFPTLSIVPDIKVGGNGLSKSNHHTSISENEIFFLCYWQLFIEISA